MQLAQNCPPEWLMHDSNSGKALAFWCADCLFQWLFHCSLLWSTAGGPAPGPRGQFVTVSGSSKLSWNHSRCFMLGVLICIKDCLAMDDKLVRAIIVRKSVHLGNHNFSVATINANSTIPSASGMQISFHHPPDKVFTSLWTVDKHALQAAQKQTMQGLYKIWVFLKHWKWLFCKTTLLKENKPLNNCYIH